MRRMKGIKLNALGWAFLVFLVLALAPYVIEGIRFLVGDLIHSYDQSLGDVLYRARRSNEGQYHLFKFALYCIPIVFILRKLYEYFVLDKMNRNMTSRDDRYN